MSAGTHRAGAGYQRQRPTRQRHERSAVALLTPVTVPHTAGARMIDPARCSSPQPARSPTAAAQLGYWGLQASRHACTCGKKRCAVTTVAAVAAPSPVTASARREPTLIRRLCRAWRPRDRGRAREIRRTSRSANTACDGSPLADVSRLGARSVTFSRCISGAGPALWAASRTDAIWSTFREPEAGSE